MRKGVNKSKLNPEIELDSYHRIIIPVFIPNLEEEYYKDALPILEYCLVSILRTVHSKTRLSVINNGSCKEVVDFLNRIKSQYSSFDQIYHSDINLGKINAINAVLRGNIEPVITITDSDVLFLNGWQEAIEKLFTQIPEAGMISPVPSSIGFENINCSTTMGKALFSNRFSFGKVANVQGLIRFQESIGRNMYQEAHLNQYPVYKNKETTAVIGCGHFCFTIKRKVLNNAPIEPCDYKLLGIADQKYFDIPIDKSGTLRLATLDNYAYHLGNVEESWMKKEVPLKSEKKINYCQDLSELHLENKAIDPFVRIIGKIVIKTFKKYPKIKMWYFKRKGLKYNYY